MKVLSGFEPVHEPFQMNVFPISADECFEERLMCLHRRTSVFCLFLIMTETEFCSAVSLPHISDNARPQSHFYCFDMNTERV